MPSAVAERRTPNAERRVLQAGTHKVPREAMRFRVPLAFQFAAGDASSTHVPVRIVARTPDVVDHWWWGAVIHDMTGVQFKDKIPLDWCHWWDINVGYADDIQADETTGLVLGGQLISVRDDDYAADIIKRGKLGVPYEASIDCAPPWRIEVVGEGMSAECNGQTVEGPITIFREWTLKATAICPFGVDSGTSAEFSKPNRRDEPAEIEVTLFSKEPAMAKQATTNADTKQATDSPAEAQQLSSPPQNPPASSTATEDPAKAFAAKLAQFTAEFGAVHGSKWAAEGKSYEDALKLHAAELSTQLAAAGKTNEELTAKLKAVDTGEKDAVSFSDGGKPGVEKKTQLAAKLGDNVAAFATSLKMPSAAKA